MSLPNAMQLSGQNWLDKNCGITVSGGDAVKPYLYDQKRATQWQSSGSDDTVTETVTITFNDDSGAAVTRRIDMFILLNTNVRGLSASYTDAAGASHNIPDLNIADNEEENLIIEFSDYADARTFTLSMATTMEANGEKKVGELKLCELLINLEALTSFSRKDYANQGHYYLKTGELVRWREFSKVAGSLSLSNVSKDQRDALNTAIANFDFLTFIFYSEYDASSVYEFAVTEMPSETFDRRTQLFEIGLELTER